MTEVCGWLVLSVAGAPSLPAPVAAVVSAGSGVEVLSLGDGDGELDPGLGDVVGELDDGTGELLFELAGLEKRAFGLEVFLQSGDVVEPTGWLDEGTADPEPSGFGCPPAPPGLDGLVP